MKPNYNEASMSDVMANIILIDKLEGVLPGQFDDAAENRFLQDTKPLLFDWLRQRLEHKVQLPIAA